MTSKGILNFITGEFQQKVQRCCKIKQQQQQQQQQFSLCGRDGGHVEHLTF